MLKKTIIVYLLLSVLPIQLWAVCNKSGVYKIGPGGAYTSLTAALNDLKSTGAAGAVVFELKSNYNASVETFPLTFNNIPCISSTNTLTIRPEVGATGLILQNNGTVINFNMSRFVIIDGRPGGTGTASELQISGGANQPTISFINDASNNFVQFTYITGTVNNPASGVIAFTTSNQTVTNGNNDNVIRNCTISGNGGSVNCIYSAGSSGKKNFGNTISNCNLVGFESANASTPASAIKLLSNSMFWTVDSNNIYFPNNITFSTCMPVYINDTTSNAFYVRGNYIGGTMPQCGGPAPSIYNNNFTGIYIACSKVGFSNIQGNTVANLNWSNLYTQQYFAGIHIAAGNVRCGTLNGNTIGSMSQNYSIVTTSNYLTDPNVYGILVSTNFGNLGTLDSIQIKNNNISGITCTPGSGNYLDTPLKGIAVLQQQEGHITISNNNIGSASLLKSLYSTISMGNYATVGIYVQVTQNNSSFGTYNISNIISNNIIQHLHGEVAGIKVEGGTPLIKNNIIKNLTDGVPGSTTGSAVVIGIAGDLLTSGTVITENKIFDCKLYGQYAASVNGIVIDNSEAVEVSKNFIHTFETEGDYIPVTGIAAYSSGIPYHGKHRIVNNMIRFGVDSSGTVMNKSMEISGIIASFDSVFISHNSIYLTGSGDADTRAIYIKSANNNYARITNNIFSNMRLQQPASNWFRNTAVGFDKVFNVPLAGLYFANNIYQITSGNNNNTVVFNNTPYITLQNWQQFSGLDNNSLTGNPSFINPNGNVLNVNLHVALNSIADMAGIAEPSIPLDFDNEVRAQLTPVDIGADALNPSTTNIVDEQNYAATLGVYPNPAMDVVFAILANDDMVRSVLLAGVDGRIIVPEFAKMNGRIRINTADLSTGIYQIVVQTDSSIATQKIFILKD